MLNIKIDSKLILSGIPKKLYPDIIKALTIDNPKWLENNKQGRYNFETPRFLEYHKEAETGLIVPRGFLRELLDLIEKQGVLYCLKDDRRKLPDVNFTFTGKLKSFQAKAVKKMMAKYFGTLSAATGSGKTVMALKIIAERKQPALILVHTKELLNQWIDRIQTFLGIPKDKIGIIGGGKKTIGKAITVATVQSLYKCADKVSPHIGHLIVDECHRAPSRTFTEAVTAFDSKYMLGLSATPWRRDGLSKLIYWHIGDVIHEVDKADLIKNGHVLQADVITRETDFETNLDPSNEYSKMLSELCKDQDRNWLIARDVVNEVNAGDGICLVLSDRKAHCQILHYILESNYNISGVEILTGSTSAKQRKDIIKRLNDGKVKVFIATGQLVGEGFDCKQLSTLFLTTPIRFDGRVIQYLGRVLRSAPGKSKAKVYDYVDSRVGVLEASAKARQKVYNRGLA